MKLSIVLSCKLLSYCAALLIPWSLVVTTVLPSPTFGATLRIASTRSPETLDPASVADQASIEAAGTLFDQLYTYDYLARPLTLRPLAAASMPSVSADGRELTIRIRPNIRFAPHVAFGNRPRELTAEDFVYSMKRFMDPAIHAPLMTLLTGKIEGFDELGNRSAGKGGRFNYDTVVPGLVAADRHTVRIRLTRPDPTFIYFLANPQLSIVPREAVEADGNEFARHPTGSGPYVVRDFKPGLRLVLERSPAYRTMRWEDVATPGPDSPDWTSALRGRRFPLPDRVEWLAIPEPTTRLLALERGEIDVAKAPPEAIENDRLVPRLAQKGFNLVRAPTTWVNWFSFNMRDPQVGGTAADKMALRRAIAMAIDDEEYVRVILGGSGSAPRYWIPPGIGGHDPSYRYPIHYDPATANALLDRFGFRKRRDGFRGVPDGSELTLTFQVGTGSRDRQLSEFLKRSFDRLGIRCNFEALPTTEQISRQETCHYQLLNTEGWLFDWPDGSDLMLAFYGQSAGFVNMACMRDGEFDALYERLRVTPLGGERVPLYRRLFERLEVLGPVRLLPTRDDMYLTAPNVRGLLPHPALLALYPYLDVVPKTK